METADWRIKLQPSSRQRMVNKIIEIFKSCLPLSGQQGERRELKKKAMRFEQIIHTASTSLQEYRSNSKMSIRKTKSPNSIQPNAATSGPASSDSIVQMGDANGADWQEVVYQKVMSMKEMYLPELKNLYQEIVSEELQQDSLPQQPQNEQIANLNMLKNMVPVILVLQLNKHDIELQKKEKLLQVEKDIASLLSSNRHRRSTLSLLQGKLLQAPTQLQQPQSLDSHQQQQAKPQQTLQLPVHQMSLHQMIGATDIKMRRQLGTKTGVLQKQQSVGQHVISHHPQLKSGTSSPQVNQALSPLVTQHPSLQIDQQNMLSSLTKAGSPLQSATSPFVVPSPSTVWAPSPMPGDFGKVGTGLALRTAAGNIKHQQATVACAPAQSPAVGTSGISASPLLAEFSTLDSTHANGSAVVSGKSTVEQPLERLMKVVKNMSLKALNLSVSDISSVVSTIDRKAGSAPENGSRAAVAEDMVAMSKYLQAINNFTQDGPTGTKKLKRYANSNVILSSCSVNDSFWQLNGSEASASESTATSGVKKPRLEVNHDLVEEIQNINRQLIDTVVEISDKGVDPSALTAATEDGEGTTIKCSFTAVALNLSLKSQYASAQMSAIQPLRLLVPANCPDCSVILLDKFPVDVSEECEDQSMKAKLRLSLSLKSLSQPMSLKDIARTWDVCTHEVTSEYAQQSGGGTFSSKYGSWENCLSAA